MHIWCLEKWEEIYSEYNIASGLHLHFDKDVDPEVRRACKEFCKWLRREFYFPVRVNIYIKSPEKIIASDGSKCTGLFISYDEREFTPRIKIAAGDYEKSRKRHGQDNALAGTLGSIAHELTHYFQYINDIKLTDRGGERQATQYAGYILDEYKDIRECP